MTTPANAIAAFTPPTPEQAAAALPTLLLAAVTVAAAMPDNSHAQATAERAANALFDYYDSALIPMETMTADHPVAIAAQITAGIGIAYENPDDSTGTASPAEIRRNVHTG